MKRRIILLMFATLGITATAQTNSEKGLIDECQRLYSEGEYSTALALAGKIETGKLDNRTRQEAELLKALITAETDAAEGNRLLQKYISSYPESAKEGLLCCHVARTYYYTGNYKTACEWFSKSDMSRLTPVQRERAMLYYALSLQECGKQGEAENLLRNIALTGKKYGKEAAFQLAITDYDKNNLDEAYRTFKELEFEDDYHIKVPYYIAGIYLKQGNYSRAQNIAERFIADHADNIHGLKMQQILGAANYYAGNYKEAVKPLTEYVNRYPSPQRIAKYQLAVSLFETEEYNDALGLFDSCSEGDDAISQSSLLHIGTIQRTLGNNNSARMAFGQAAEMSHDRTIQEVAMYNYALSLHETRYSPFAESVKVFERFLNEFPGSVNSDKVESYLVEVYMNTRNYDIALQSIEKIENPSAEILEAKQKILYRTGIQKYLDADMEACIESMNRSIALRYDNATYSDACFWRGEALYNCGEYAAAANSYRQTLAAGGENSTKAIYGLGYTYFQQGNYEEARSEFERFLNNCPAGEKELRADAFSRIGDSYFYQRNYADANRYYSKAVESDSRSGDYALFRSAIAQGLRQEYDNKVGTLRLLIKEYPGSIYAEQAHYEMGRAYIENRQFNEAHAAYDELMAKYPQSPFARRAMTEKAMIYNIQGNKEKAIATYKETIEKYPHSEEARIAVQDLKNIYIEMGEVDKFADYAARTSSVGSISSNSIDTLTFIAAEKFYNKGDTENAAVQFKEYLVKFPQGAFRLNSNYYLGTIYHKKGMNDEAIEHLEEVIEFPDNKYSETAIALAAGIYFGQGNYRAADELYRELAVKSSNEENRMKAKTGIMRSTFQLGKYEETIKYAGELLADGNIAPELKREALFDRAKAYRELNKRENAMQDLKTLASDTRTREGAEAKYIIAQMMFDNGDYKECESEIMDYIETGTPHSYWMARSFILLSDLYSAQGKTLEAKQYLQSLKSNYSGDDDIEELITERMEKLTRGN